MSLFSLLQSDKLFLASSSETCTYPSLYGRNWISKDINAAFVFVALLLQLGPPGVCAEESHRQSCSASTDHKNQTRARSFMAAMLRDYLHWLPILQRCSTSVSWLFFGRLPSSRVPCRLLRAMQSPNSEVSGRQHLQFVSCCRQGVWLSQTINIPRFRHSIFGSRLSQSPSQRFVSHCLIRCVIRESSLNAVGGTWTLENAYFSGHV